MRPFWMRIAGGNRRLLGAVCLAVSLGSLSVDAFAGQKARRVWQPKQVEKGVSVSVAGASTFLAARFYDIYLPLRPGPGMALGLGYRWSRYLQTYLVLTYTEHRTKPGWLWRADYGFLLAEIQVVVPVARWGRFKPAAVVCYGRGALAGGEESFGGVSLAAGLQLEYFLSRRWTLAVVGYARYIDYDRVQYRLPTLLSAGTVDGSHFTLFWLRLAWHLGKL